MEETHANVPPPEHIMVLNGQGWIGLIDRMGTETTIVNAARVSFGRRKETMDARDRRLLAYLLEHRHTSPFEHVTFTFAIHCPLFVRAQWQRHRTWSYNEISRRYTDIDMQFYTPPVLRAQAVSDRQASVSSDAIDQEAVRAQIEQQNRDSLALYHRLLAGGVCREQARGVLTQNMMTTFWGTVDLHNLISFLDLRDSEHAQWEIRQYARGIKRLVSGALPTVAEVLNW